MSKHTYIGMGQYNDRQAHVYVLAHDNYAAQAVADRGRTTFRLGEFPTEEEAMKACEDYVKGEPYE